MREEKGRKIKRGRERRARCGGRVREGETTPVKELSASTVALLKPRIAPTAGGSIFVQRGKAAAQLRHGLRRLAVVDH